MLKVQNNKNDIQTILVENEVIQCDNEEDLRKNIRENLLSLRERWREKINQIIRESGNTNASFSRLCGISRQSISGWCNQGDIPNTREIFLKVGMAAGYDVKQMNELLQKYGCYSALYPKNLEDCVCIFVLNHQYGDQAVEKYTEILNRIKTNVLSNANREGADITTEKFEQEVMKVENEDDLEKFVAINSPIFSKAYQRFCNYVESTVITPGLKQYQTENVYSMSIEQGWRKSFRDSVYKIMQKKWYPTREKIIALGLHFCMEKDQINEMLDRAHMSPLYAKNIFENIIIYILESASIEGHLDKDNPDFDQDVLCKNTRELIKRLDIPETREFLKALPEVGENSGNWE